MKKQLIHFDPIFQNKLTINSQFYKKISNFPTGNRFWYTFKSGSSCIFKALNNSQEQRWGAKDIRKRYLNFLYVIIFFIIYVYILSFNSLSHRLCLWMHMYVWPINVIKPTFHSHKHTVRINEHTRVTLLYIHVWILNKWQRLLELSLKCYFYPI